jgi:hypothetical protein
MPIGANLSKNAYPTGVLPHTPDAPLGETPRPHWLPLIPSPFTGRGGFVARQKRGGVPTT